MFKNVTGQKIQLFAFDITTGAAKTGDTANITAYVSKDHGTVTVLGDTSATQMDATNAPGVYVFDLTQGETNADELTFTAKSSTSGVSITPRFISTVPAKFTTMVIDAAGLVDSTSVKMGPSGSATAQTARDIGASVLLSAGTGTGQLDFTSGVVKGNVTQWLGSAVSTPTVAGVPNVNAKTWNDLATVALPLVPTVAGRTLDVSTGGEAGVDWANVGSPTTSLALTGTTIATTQKVDVETIKTNPVVNAGTVTFPTTATLASTTNITAGTIATVTNLTNAPTAGDFTATMKTSIGTAVAASAVASVTGNVGGNVVGSVASVTARVTANTDQLAGQTVTAAAGVTFPTSVASPTNITAGTITTVTNLTNAPTAGDLTATMKTSVTTAATAATPTAAAVTGAVGSVTGLTASDVGAIKTQTDKLTFTVANQIDANVLDWKSATAPAMTGDAFARLGAPAGASVSADVAAVKADTAAIKAKTDNLPASPAATSDIPTAGAVADAVWDEALSGHAGVGSTGAALSGAGAAGDPWSTLLPGAYGAGTAGQIVGDSLDSTISSRASQITADAIQAKTDGLPSDPADASDVAAAVAATKLYADRTVVRGTVSGTSPTTTTFTASALSPAGVDADQFKGRIIIFDNATTTTALRGQATDITLSSAAGLPLFTFSALTIAPQSGDTFSIV